MRRILVFIAILATITFLSLISPTANADTECGNRFFDGRAVCTVGILSSDFDEQDLEVSSSNTQERMYWCWAASVSMIFKWYGYEVSQQEIVSQTFGSAQNRAAYGFQITDQLNKTYKTKDGRSFKVRASVHDVVAGRFSVTNSNIIESLEQGRPLLIGASGHAMVLTAVHYIRNPATGKAEAIIGAIVRDPWPGRGRRELTMRELFPQYLADVRIDGGSTRQAADLNRIDRCMTNCGQQLDACLDLSKEELDNCSDNADRFCDSCDNYRGIARDQCDKVCDRRRDACFKDDERKQERCTKKSQSCMDSCK